MAFRLVNHDGSTLALEGDVPRIGDAVGEYRVDFVDGRDTSVPVVYLGLWFGQGAISKLVVIDTERTRCPLTLTISARD